MTLTTAGGGEKMKTLTKKKTKRNSIEAYAVCICAFTCSCGPCHACGGSQPVRQTLQNNLLSDIWRRSGEVNGTW